MAVARIKLLRNKREAVVKQMRRDIALLLQSGQDATARIRVLFPFPFPFSFSFFECFAFSRNTLCVMCGCISAQRLMFQG